MDVVKIFVIYLNVYFWERYYIANDFINNLKLTYKFIRCKPKDFFFLKRERKEKKAFISLDLIIRNIIQLKKSDPILENECPLVFLKLKLGCLLPALVTVFLTASPFTDLIQCISLTFITYSTSFLKTVVIVWLNPFPPAKSCVVSVGHTSGHRGHFVLLMLKPCWTAPV